MTLVDDIEQIIISNVPDAKVLVHNNNDDGEHFEAIVISKSFNGVSLLRQHQAIMRPLKAAFDERVHALALKTFSEQKWDLNKKDYPIIEEKIKEKYK